MSLNSEELVNVKLGPWKHFTAEDFVGCTTTLQFVKSSIGGNFDYSDWVTDSYNDSQR